MGDADSGPDAEAEVGAAPEPDLDRSPGRPSRRVVVGGLLVGGAVALAGAGALVWGRRHEDDGPGEPGPGVGREIAYGPGHWQRGALSRPLGASGPVGVVALVHGGFWRSGFDRRSMEPLAEAVVAAGWAAWNLDHRPTDDGGGWPTTFTDIAAGIDHLSVMAAEHGLDPARVAILGHEAGGTLALWAAGRVGLPAGAPGADPVIRPVAAVAYAGITSLTAASLDGLGGGAVDALMGGPPTAARDEDYRLASPSDRLPLDAPQLLVHGRDDPIVPLRQSSAHAARAEAAGDEIRLEVLDGVDHLDPLDPSGEAWSLTARWLEGHLR